LLKDCESQNHDKKSLLIGIFNGYQLYMSKPKVESTVNKTVFFLLKNKFILLPIRIKFSKIAEKNAQVHYLLQH